MTERGSKSQSDKFKEAARELGCDADEATFGEQVRTIVKRVRQVPEDVPYKGD